MSDVTYEELEAAFEQVIEKNRRGQTRQPCDREALFAHAFFYTQDSDNRGLGIVPNRLPFDRVWVVTSYKGLAICALVERLEGMKMIRPDYLWYPSAIPGHKIMTTEAEMDERAAFIIDQAVERMLMNHLEEVDSSVQSRINRGREKTIGKPSFIPQLPAFIRITNDPQPEDEDKGGTHASPQPHNRRGHWRTYKSDGRQVWINETKVLGGSPFPRNYRVET